jgi:PAS domain S-box-containing protein
MSLNRYKLLMTRIVDGTGNGAERSAMLNAQQALQLEEGTSSGRVRRAPVAMGALHNAALVQMPLGVGYANRDGTFIWCNAAFEKMLGLKAGEYLKKSIRDLTHAEDQPHNEQLLADLWEGRRQSYALEKRYLRADGSEVWMHVTASMIRTRDGQPVCTMGFIKDITARKQMQFEVERVQKALVEASRQAGMAEVATNVLHNVGNVLNSVNVSASIVSERIKGSKGTRLAEVAALIEDNQADLPYFFGEDERGRKLPAYLAALAGQLTSERDALLKELADLRANLDHIREAVSLQQTHARRGGTLETMTVVELVEDALRMNIGALTRHRVALERDYRDRPGITVERHKVLQVLFNLIGNAKCACDESGRHDKQVSVRIEAVPEGVCISVIDNGVGMSREVMRRLFTHGFTTRKHGHGFGLHSASLAAAELGGTLLAASDGPGRGATFRLTMPLHPPGDRHD